MRRIAVIFTIVFVLIGSSSCSGGIQKEAEGVIMQELNQYVVKCGDFFYFKAKKWIYQNTKINISITEDTSEADRLNGLEYSGKVEITFDGVTRHFDGRSWSEWYKILTFATCFSASLEKSKDGRWKAEFYRPAASDFDFSHITCSDVPK